MRVNAKREAVASTRAPKQQEVVPTVCMHVNGVARTDARVMREARALVAAGYAVTIVDVERDRKLPRVEMFDGVRLKHVIMPSRFVPVRFKPWFVVKALRLQMRTTRAVLGERADVYHAHDDNALSACYRAARLRRKALVLDAHELPLVAPSVTRWKRLSAIAARHLRKMMPRCDGVITVSPPIATELQRRYGGKLATVVRNMPSYQPPLSSNRLREHLGIGPDVRVALYQGYLLEDRGLDRLVHAAKFLRPGDMIVLMGDGASKPGLEVLVAREGVGDRVKFIPAVPYAELLQWTASATVGLVIFPPSYSLNIQWCLPNKLFEYLMAGVPVLASSLDAVAAILATYDCGRIVASTEYSEIGGAISDMLADANGLARMRRNALAAAQRDLSWEHERLRLIELYSGVLGRPSPVAVTAPAAAE